MIKTFSRGIHPKDKKGITAESRIETMELPSKLKDKNYHLSKFDLIKKNDISIVKSIIEIELFNLFKGNAIEQLIYYYFVIINTFLYYICKVNTNTYLIYEKHKISSNNYKSITTFYRS